MFSEPALHVVGQTRGAVDDPGDPSHQHKLDPATGERREELVKSGVHGR